MTTYKVGQVLTKEDEPKRVIKAAYKDVYITEDIRGELNFMSDIGIKMSGWTPQEEKRSAYCGVICCLDTEPDFVKHNKNCCDKPQIEELVIQDINTKFCGPALVDVSSKINEIIRYLNK